MHTWIGTGHIGQDAELRYTRHNQPVVVFRAAFDSGFGNAADTLWLDIVMAGKLAESGIVRYLLKGQAVWVEGMIGPGREYRRRDGSLAMTLSVQARDVQLIGKREWRQQAPRQTVAEETPA